MESPQVNVRVGFANADYGNICAELRPSDDREVVAAWWTLAGLLAGRSGWHFDVANWGPHRTARWGLGFFGAALLSIEVDEAAGFACFDYEEDSTSNHSSISEVEQWLAGREERAKQPNAAQVELAQHNGWWGLKAHRYTVVVSWSDGYYSATVLGTMLDASFGETLQQAVNRAGEMLCGMYGAPTELASELYLVAELERSATDHLRESGK
ncbi:hypothetical protein KDL01_10165 [Actinospica durhamensis]|uniref:Uncharacterized protein n=1 Tax=Actinospica durhamensis TaxID=1508375 RepID=A0A941EJG4_9ACTN|nr:hypothetical protein [Actinospica durhamensis]MBR7833630.1 hypothetical protein [Actinospica durhamensis]